MSAFQDWRLAALERAGYCCEWCGLTNEQSLAAIGDSLHVHHIQPRADGGGETPENARVLCWKCHKWAEPKRPPRPEIAEGCLTVSVEVAGKILGIGRTAAYEAAREGRLPALRFGSRFVVSIKGLEAMLGRAPLMGGR